MAPKINRRATNTICSLCNERKLVAIVVGEIGNDAHCWYKCLLCDESGAQLRLASQRRDDK
jgi:hypothetical protein